jgi:uncharacterized FAD-dependent dehydrogenase
MQDYLAQRIEILNNTSIKALIVDDKKIKGLETTEGTKITADYVIVAPGREGADWLSQEFAARKIKMINNAVDIGVRVELPAPVMEPLTSRLYESKLIYHSPTFGDEVRTFCMNPNGEVVSENYNGIVTVFTEPFKEPITYGQHIASLANMLGGGILVQRFGDLLDGRRSTAERMKASTIKPTLESATPGDLSLVLPYRQLMSIIEMLYALDKIAPGVASRYTLLYGVEVKFYSARVALDNNFETKDIKN